MQVAAGLWKLVNHLLRMQSLRKYFCWMPFDKCLQEVTNLWSISELRLHTWARSGLRRKKYNQECLLNSYSSRSKNRSMLCLTNQMNAKNSLTYFNKCKNQERSPTLLCSSWILNCWSGTRSSSIKNPSLNGLSPKDSFWSIKSPL